MKKIPLLICCVVGLVLMPWHFILPKGEEPYPEVSLLPPATVTQYRAELAKKGVQDPRPDDFVILDIGRESVKNQRAAEGWKNDPAFMMRYENLEWANRRPSYFVRVLENIYGDSSSSLLKSKAWIVPCLLLLIYGVSHSVSGLFARRSDERAK